MPWKVRDAMSLREEFVVLASQEDANVSELCRRYGISRTAGYKWIGRYAESAREGLADHSRRPWRSPERTSPEMEAAVLALRKRHPAWGGRKLRARLLAQGWRTVPAVSTVTEILRRHGVLDARESVQHKPFTRFERERPNELWQMDFKGHFATDQGRCHPLTVLDDHSRFALGLEACPNEQGQTVQAELTRLFRRHGLPERMLMDNGAPWGDTWGHPYTPLTVWMIRLGVAISHGRPYHPQTQGKEKRFHRMLKAEVLRYERFPDLTHCQQRFEEWRRIYNHERPHEALGMQVPASRYSPSSRPFPETPPPIEYGPGDIVRKVQDNGRIHFRGTEYRVPKAFKGYPVALRHTDPDGVIEVYFCSEHVATLDPEEHNAT